MSRIIYELSVKNSNKQEDVSLVEREDQIIVYLNKEIVQVLDKPVSDYIKRVLEFSESHVKSMNDMLIKQRNNFIEGSSYLKEELIRLYSKDKRTFFDELISDLLNSFNNVWCSFYEKTVEFAYWSCNEKEENLTNYFINNGFIDNGEYFEKENVIVKIRKSNVISNKKTKEKKEGFIVKISRN